MEEMKYPPQLQSIPLEMKSYLGDNCIVFEYFTASIGDLMVAN
jgi:hypothetical protein